MSIVLFEDAQCERLAPVTYARIACNIHCGSFRLADIVEQLQTSVHAIVRPHLESQQRIDHPLLQSLDSVAHENATTRPTIMLNARLTPSMATREGIATALQHGREHPNESLAILDRDYVAAIINPPWAYSDLQLAGFDGLSQLLESAKDFATPTNAPKLTTFAFPHEIVACNMACIEENLELRIRVGLENHSLTQLQDGVFVAQGAQIGEYVLTDTRKGPIIVERGAQIGPYTLLRGPIYIGPKTKILEHSAIKDCVTLAHTTKIGGEVEASIVEPFTNKQHHGFLGHSYLGSWINLGAGTCNSDLKNTYGTVNMEYSYGKAATQMQFLGCIMGDYSKTAINTGIFTGKVIGVCSMMYGFVTSNVPSFVNYARLFGQVASLPPEVMVSTQQRMFARRDVAQRGCDIQLIYDMHRITQSERDRLGEALVF